MIGQGYNPVLRSSFLIDLRELFRAGRRGSPSGLIEINEEEGADLGDSIEILSNTGRGHELFVYQTLTVWADQVATFAVRESVKKRMYRLVYELREFPLTTTPIRIVKTYWCVRDQLRGLNVPPGTTEADRRLLQGIE